MNRIRQKEKRGRLTDAGNKKEKLKKKKLKEKIRKVQKKKVNAQTGFYPHLPQSETSSRFIGEQCLPISTTKSRPQQNIGRQNAASKR